MASSLAHQTGTQIDTGGRIMQACRVNTDYLKSTVKDDKELINDPMKYCMHKDEIAVSCGKPLITTRLIIIRNRPTRESSRPSGKSVTK